MSKMRNLTDTLSDLYKQEPTQSLPQQALADKAEKSSTWEDLIKVNVLLEPRQKDFLDLLAKRIMRGRKRAGERITANSILRCLVDLLESKSHSLDLSEISNESELVTRFLAVL